MSEDIADDFQLSDEEEEPITAEKVCKNNIHNNFNVDTKFKVLMCVGTRNLQFHEFFFSIHSDYF